jgi:hypothetical protein
MTKELNGKPTIIKGKLVPKFLQPVFYNEKHDIYYYIIESPTTIQDDPERYQLNSKVEVGTAYFSLNYAMVTGLLQQGKDLFVQIKSPDLPYIKGIILSKDSLEDHDIYLGKETSKYKTSGNYMFALDKTITIKEKEI